MPDDTNDFPDIFVAVAETILAGADLSVLKTDSPDPVGVGNNLTYTVTVINNGPQEATGVRLIDDLPIIDIRISNATAAAHHANEARCWRGNQFAGRFHEGTASA